jgi:hypothetical protein
VSSPPDAFRAAARRFALLVLSTAALSAVVSLLIGLAAGSGALRALSVGFYVSGSLGILVGLALGLRGPIRPGRAGIRFISAREQEDAISDSALFVVLGLALLVLGVLTDSRFPIF